MMTLQMTWQHRSRKEGPPLGLKNLGNTCYLNSVLQCLTYTPPLAQFCLSSQHSSLCTAVMANTERECPFCILEHQIARSLSLERPLDAPSKISKCITLYAEHFRWGRQEDAHEFLRYVIDACHNTCLRLLSRLSGLKPNTNGRVANGTAAKEDSGEAGGGRSTVMKEIFGGELLSQVKCLGCKGESNKTDEIMDISLDLFQSNSLKDVLGCFFQPEVLNGNNKYSCGNCKKLCVARKQMFIQRAPNVLVIQLKRFEGIHGGKINRNIEFEEHLALMKYMCNGSQDPQPEYNLFGSIVHSGCSPESGHYYAYVKNAYGQWYCCNDAYVSLSSIQEVLSDKVYILFYIRCNQIPRSSKSEPPCKGLKSFSNGINVSPHQKFAELVKLPIVKPNGLISSPTNSSGSLKNGKISSNPQIKPTVLKNVELERVVMNGNGNIEAHNNASHEKCSHFGQSPDEKKHKIMEENNSKRELKIISKVEMLSSLKSTATNSSTSLQVVEHNTKKTQLVANAHESVDISKTEASESNGNVTAEKREPVFNHAASNIISEGNSGYLGFKRKACDDERAESLDMCCKESSSLSRKAVSHNMQATCNGRYPSGELEQFKEMLAREASSGLQSSGWVDRVHSFMRSRKKLCAQEPGSYNDNSELKERLINDARKTFTSQIPESLKGHLIEHLRLFCQSKTLSDP